MIDRQPAIIVQAIQAAARGEPTLHPEVQRQLMQQVISPTVPNLLDGLTEREMDVLRLIAQGNSNKEIAAGLHLTEGTVKWGISNQIN